MNAVRVGLLVCAAATILGTAACSSHDTAAPPAYDAATVSAAPVVPVKQPTDVDAGIVVALSDTSVTWADGEVVPADSGPGYTIRRLTGAGHQHTAPLAANVKLYIPFDAEGIVRLDKEDLGTVECTDRAAFKAHVLDNVRTAPRIAFDSHGDVVKMAARYAS